MTINKKPERPLSLLLLKDREVGAAEFKARCLEIMDEVQRLGVSVTITKHRKPIAKIVPADAPVAFCGSLKGVKILGDIVAPIDVEWTADEANLT